MSTVAEAFNLAVQHYQAGNFRQTEMLCRQIIQADAGNADAYHLLGVLASQNPALLDQAIALYRQALRFHPEFPEAYSNLGNAYFMKQNLPEAIAQYRHALRLRPEYLEAHNNLGLALAGKKEWDQAAHHYRQALRLNPISPETYSNLGALHLEQGQLQEAVACLQHALRLYPDFAKAHHNLGIAYQRQDKFEEAVQCHRQALRLQPGSIEVCCSLGLALEKLSRLDEAIQCYRQALQIQPDSREAWNNLGLALEAQDKPEEAMRCYQQGVKVAPNEVTGWTNLGSVLWDLARLDEALSAYDQALRCDWESADTHFNRSRLNLTRGDWVQGWPEYEWRWKTKECPAFGFQQPRWDGTPMPGRSILICAEQGFGDTLHFVRYAPWVKERCEKVIVECQAPLVPLLSGVEGIDLLVGRGAPLPPFDAHVSFLSLPNIFKATPDHIPCKVPYLFADSGLVEQWRGLRGQGTGVRDQELASRERERPEEDRFLIGIAWQGNPGFIGDRHRSIELAHFAPLAAIDGVRLISLQKGPGTEQLRDRRNNAFDVLDLGDRLDGAAGAFMDSAAIMKVVDLVISSDTSVVHLAGALGVPVWVALRQVPDWRWMMEREDCPWYPTMRLFRQNRNGDWNDVFTRMAEEVKLLSALKRNGGHDQPSASAR